MGIVYPLYYSASLHGWKFLVIEWKKFKITERMSWVNEDVCLQVVERELNGKLPRWTLARGGAPPWPVPRVVPGGCAPLREPRGEERPVRAFARPPWKRAAEHQAARRAASKLQAPREEKGQCAFPKLKSPSPGTAAAEEGEREPRVRLNSVGSQAAGAPSGQKGLSAGEEAAPGPGGSIKGSCVPAALKVTFVFRVQVKGRLQKEPPGSPPSSGIWWQEWPSSFSKMLEIQMKIAMCLPASWEISQYLCQ